MCCDKKDRYYNSKVYCYCDKSCECCNRIDSYCCNKEDDCCDNILHEYYDGREVMEEVTKYKYLGHYISNINDNSANIEAICNKAMVIKKDTLLSGNITLMQILFRMWNFLDE